MDKLYRTNVEARCRIRERIVAALSADPRISFAYLFGSFLGEGPFRDIDIGVFLMPYSGAENSLVSVELATQLTACADFPVDVRILNNAPTSFTFHALKGELLFVKDETVLARLFENTVRSYLDMAPLLRQNTREAFAP